MIINKQDYLTPQMYFTDDCMYLISQNHSNMFWLNLHDKRRELSTVGSNENCRNALKMLRGGLLATGTEDKHIFSPPGKSRNQKQRVLLKKELRSQSHLDGSRSPLPPNSLRKSAEDPAKSLAEAFQHARE